MRRMSHLAAAANLFIVFCSHANNNTEKPKREAIHRPMVIQSTEKSLNKLEKTALLGYMTQLGYATTTIVTRMARLNALKLPVQDIRTQDIIDSLPPDAMPSTRRVYINNLSSVYEHLKHLGFVDFNPCLGIRTPGFHRGIPRPLPRAALDQLLAQDDCNQRDWTVLGAYAGLRASDVVGLYPDDFVHSDAGHGLALSGKGKIEKVIPAHARVVEALERQARKQSRARCQASCEAVCVHTRGPFFRMPSSNLSTMWAGWVAKITGETYRFHQLRHRFATDVYQLSGQDLLVTRDMLRHASVVTTQVYAQVEPARAFKVVGDL
jgi:integrase